MEIEHLLYVSCLCSDEKMKELFDSADKEKPHPAAQKYHKMMVEGLSVNEIEVHCLTSFNVTKRSHPHKLIWCPRSETKANMSFTYIPFINQSILKFVQFFIYSFFYALFWGVRHKKHGVMVCDVLCLPSALGATLALRIVGVSCVGIVTDMPFYLNFQNKKTSIIKKLQCSIDMFLIKLMTHYVPLTEQMCDIINRQKKKPYIVIEGLCDIKMKSEQRCLSRDGKKHITYTGAIYEKYGLKNLIEAFMMLKHDDIVLDIYGAGAMSDKMCEYEAKDHRVHYHGVVPIEKAVEAQRKSFLLVNPRPTYEDFTKYSFPSKTMEYMVTGVPLLTTRLAGIPEDYLPYLFFFSDETINGMAKSLESILSLDPLALNQKGANARQFVLDKKNNLVQGRKVINMMCNG